MAGKKEVISSQAWPEIAFWSSQVQAARKELGLSQEALGAKVGFTQAYIAHCEASRVNPTFQTMLILRRALGKPLSYFLLPEDQQ